MSSLSEPTNEDRAARAAQILDAYDAFEAGDSETAIRDLLTDLMHHCRIEKIDFSIEYRSAQEAYNSEVGS
jgi:hypothetical protein